MSEHIYEDVQVPARYRPLLRRLQRGAWNRLRTRMAAAHAPAAAADRGRGGAAEVGAAREGLDAMDVVIFAIETAKHRPQYLAVCQCGTRHGPYAKVAVIPPQCLGCEQKAVANERKVSA